MNAEEWSSCNDALGSAERALQLLKLKQRPSGRRLSSLKGGVTFDAVRFAYPKRPTKQVLCEVSVEVKEGESLALVGFSGSGKSSLLSLMMGFYELKVW